MIFGLASGMGSVLARRVLVVLALLLPLFVFGVGCWNWENDRYVALARARDMAHRIQDTAEASRHVAPHPGAVMDYYHLATEAIVDEAAETRGTGRDCDWARDRSLILLFGKSGAPFRKPMENGAVAYPGSSVPGVSQYALSGPGLLDRDRTIVSRDIHAGDAPCLVDGTAVGVLRSFDGGAFAALQLIRFDWAGYRTLLGYAYGALLLFWALAELVAWQFNRAIYRRVGRITRVLQIVEQNGFSDRVPVDGSGEFVLLGREINTMIARLGLAHRYFADLNGFVAHNLGSPITVARALVESLVRTAAPDTSALLAEVDQQLVELDRRCAELLKRASLEEPGKASIDMAGVTTRLVNDIYGYLAQEKEMEIVLDLAPAVVAVPENTQEIIVENLMQNALKFGAHGSEIRVRLEAVNGLARLSVINSGPSVAGDRLKAIFERGVTTGGHGLGLYAVRTAARLHGGDVVALPHDGGFHALVTLPLASA